MNPFTLEKGGVFERYLTLCARLLAWLGMLAILVLSVVPANERPVTGTGQNFEHSAAFALVAGMFAVGYAWSLPRLLAGAVLYCGAIELVQTLAPTRHARLTDFGIDLAAAAAAMVIVATGRKVIQPNSRGSSI